MERDAAMAESIDALVAGKRAWPRYRVDMAARIKGVRGEYAARILDLSRGGALVSVSPGELGRDGEGPLGPAEQFTLLEQHFRDSFDLSISQHGVIVEAHVVRIVVTDVHDEDLKLGCCFVAQLTDLQQQRLGIAVGGEEGGSWGEATVEHPLTHAADAARPVAVFLSRGADAEHGPACLAQVIAVGPAAFVVRVERSHHADALQAIGDQAHASLRFGTRVLHEAVVRPASWRYVDSPRPATEVLLVAEGKLPRVVRKHFRRV